MLAVLIFVKIESNLCSHEVTEHEPFLKDRFTDNIENGSQKERRKKSHFSILLLLEIRCLETLSLSSQSLPTLQLRKKFHRLL